MGEVIELRTVRDAVSLLDQWREQAERMEALYQLASLRADMAEALYGDALAELERVRGLLK